MSLAHPVVEVLGLRVHSNDTVCQCVHRVCCTATGMCVSESCQHGVATALLYVPVSSSGASLSLSRCSIQAPVLLVARSGTVLLSSRPCDACVMQWWRRRACVV
jgi:hypothetical protein